MPEAWLFPDRPVPLPVEPDLAVALERAAGAIARLDQALAMHPLPPAFLYSARLEAVRRQAAVNGHGLDPWHLAANLEGLRLRMDDATNLGLTRMAESTAVARYRKLACTAGW